MKKNTYKKPDIEIIEVSSAALLVVSDPASTKTINRGYTDQPSADDIPERDANGVYWGD